MIQVEALTRTYGDLTAVDQVSFNIGQGEIVGLLGHNGAGKTTIMKMLTGFLEPTNGSISVDGLDIQQEREAVQQHIGYLPENDPLYYDMTVIDYLDYAARLHGVTPAERNDRISDAILKTELTAKASDVISTLSRGFRQRVGVAQAILHNPKLLILDEPTNGLDPTQVQHMRELIRSLAKTATVILSTHILHEVQAICDRVIIIHNGKKVVDSNMATLLSSKHLIVTVNTEPVSALTLLSTIDNVASVKPQTSVQATTHHTYTLELDDDADPTETAPQVADLITKQGWKLYQLQTEHRDLEQIFKEISTRQAPTMGGSI